MTDNIANKKIGRTRAVSMVILPERDLPFFERRHMEFLFLTFLFDHIIVIVFGSFLDIGKAPFGKYLIKNHSYNSFSGLWSDHIYDGMS
jgi:hypothetical protein